MMDRFWWQWRCDEGGVCIGGNGGRRRLHWHLAGVCFGVCVGVCIGVDGGAMCAMEAFAC